MQRFFVYFSVSMIVLDGILSILTDAENGSTQNSDLSDVTNLDQNIVVINRRREGTQIWGLTENRSVNS